MVSEVRQNGQKIKRKDRGVQKKMEVLFPSLSGKIKKNS